MIDYLEASESEYKSQYDVVITDKDLLNASKSKYIIKMHGDVQHPDTIVYKGTRLSGVFTEACTNRIIY